ncbi:hypothetical protein BH10CYA1_BH10CYA1_20370 [soil metagenome]
MHNSEQVREFFRKIAISNASNTSPVLTPPASTQNIVANNNVSQFMNRISNAASNDRNTW